MAVNLRVMSTIITNNNIALGINNHGPFSLSRRLVLVPLHYSYPDWRGVLSFFLDVSSIISLRRAMSWICVFRRSILTAKWQQNGVFTFHTHRMVENGILPRVLLVGLPGHWLRRQPNCCASRINGRSFWRLEKRIYFAGHVSGSEVSVCFF